MSDLLTNALLNSSNSDDIIAAIKKETPRYHGYPVVDVRVNRTLTIIGEATRSDGVTVSVILLETDLHTAQDLIGRKHHCGLGAVDLEIIRNILR